MTDEQKKIVIDMAGAMEKITPEMMDLTRDLMIEGLTKSAKQMHDGLSEIARMCEANYDYNKVEILAVAKAALPK